MQFPLRVGIVGVGKISAAYFKGLQDYPDLQLVACCDLDADRARTAAAEYQIQAHASLDTLLADPTIDLVVNLTIPKAHAPIN